MEENRLKVHENRALRTICGHKREMVGGWGTLHNGSFITLTLHQILLG
jgi:hypothetical protein